MFTRSLFVLLFTTVVSCGPRVEKSVELTELIYPPGLKIIHRSDWGWMPLERTITRHAIKYITLHHGGEDFPASKDPVEYLRSLQSWSRAEKGWIDIPYHFMIDLSAKIYETRPIDYPGDTNTKYDPAGHALVCVMGNYENQILSEQQLDAVVAVSAYLAHHFGVASDSIRGHKDYTETLCPGKDFYTYIQDGTVSRRVAASLAVGHP